MLGDAPTIGAGMPRFGPYDFKSHSRDGLGMDWPISYDDVAPYYDRTEKLIGVYGTNAGLRIIPIPRRAFCIPRPSRASPS
jgi:choline dehydrogenase-like flavoprotein